MLRWMMPSAPICGVTLSTTPSVIDCGVTIVCSTWPVVASTCDVVTKNTSCVPTRITAGSLFIAMTRGLAITLTLPWLANASSRPCEVLDVDAHRERARTRASAPGAA